MEVRQGERRATFRTRAARSTPMVVDPPYYANVQYAELSDFFYVWEKRSLGHLYPELFATGLTDKDARGRGEPGAVRGARQAQGQGPRPGRTTSGR
ncbi:MAG: hypothetical protein KatS3mg014_1254 [Actinomycetota bacterium]|nr:MAG: hypothetical protein KatS3mg014_1254 [Actinomycetota bacterium]